MTVNDLKLPPIADNYRWKITRIPGDIITSAGWRVELQKKRLFRWKTVSESWANIHEGQLAIEDAADRAFVRHFEYQDAVEYEGIVNGNSEYRKK